MDGHLLSVQYRIRQRVKTRPLGTMIEPGD